MDIVQRKVEELKNRSNKEYLKLNQNTTNEDVINRSYAYQKNYNQRDLDIPENCSNYENRSQIENNAFSPRNLNNSNYLEKNSDVSKTLKKEVYSQSNQNLIRNRSEFMNKDQSYPKTIVPSSDRVKQLNLANQNISPIRPYNELNENMVNSKTNEYNVPKEEFDNIYLTNKILNK